MKDREPVEEGEEYVKFNQSVIVKNGKSSTLSVGGLGYSATTTFYPNQTSNISVGSTATYSDLVTDGTHFWLLVNATNCTYNGNAVLRERSGSYWMITIPQNYDPTIPFVFT